jgi:hypothetical protein
MTTKLNLYRFSITRFLLEQRAFIHVPMLQNVYMCIIYVSLEL